MSIGMIFKIAAVGILVTILNQVLKHSGREEQAFMVSLAGLSLFFNVGYSKYLRTFATVQNLFQL